MSTTVRGPGTGRTPLFPFLVVAAALALMAAQSAAPTPLYPLYAERWGFTDFTTSQVFTVHIAVLALTLVLFGSLSDLVGRRPVAVASLALVVLGMVALATADGLGDLLLVAVTAPWERGSTLSLLYLVAYVAFGLPTLLAGLAVPHLGLAAVVECYAALVALLALAAVALGRLGRRREPVTVAS